MHVYMYECAHASLDCARICTHMHGARGRAFSAAVGIHAPSASMQPALPRSLERSREDPDSLNKYKDHFEVNLRYWIPGLSQEYGTIINMGNYSGPYSTSVHCREPGCQLHLATVEKGRPLWINYQNHLFCRLPMTSIPGLVIRT